MFLIVMDLILYVLSIFYSFHYIAAVVGIVSR